MTVTITSIAGGAPKPVFDRLGPIYERRSGNKLNALYDSMSGIAARVAAHEALDVLLMPVATIEAYIKQGIVQGACTPLANIGLAVGVTAGTPIPDVSTPEALRAALLAARGVVHAPPTATPSGAQSDKVIKTLGLAEALAGRVSAQGRSGRRAGHDRQRGGDARHFPQKRDCQCAGHCARRTAAAVASACHYLWRRRHGGEPGRGRSGGIHPVPDRAGQPQGVERLRV